MCEWSDYNVQVNMECVSASLVCESQFGQRASDPVCTTQECASASLVNVRVVLILQHRNERVLVWSMCEWSDYNVQANMECVSASLVCESQFGQRASDPVCTTQECASASLVNVRVVLILQHRNERVLVWSMCEWSGHNVRVNTQCASASVVNVRVVRL